MFNLPSNLQELRGKQKKEEWRLFHAKDFQSLMYPCFILCRILGIFPYKINASTFKVSKPYYILMTVVTCICCIYILTILVGSSLLEKLDMLSLPETLADNCLFVFGGFTMIITFILTGPRLRLLETILKISSRLPSKSYGKLSRLIHTKDIISSLLVGFILILVTVSRNRLKINFLFQIYIQLVVFQMDMLYINCVCVLKECFKSINNNLMDMRRIIVNESHIPRLIYHDQRKHFLIMELKALKKQHLAISDTVRMLNIIFSLQLLTTVVNIFSNTTISLYYYILFCKHFIITSKITLFHVCFLSYMAYDFIKIALIVWACETGKNQALKISVSIHDVFNIATDEQIKAELQLFSLQILHSNNKFSAKGLVIDAKLFTAIIGSITMYVIILFQFISMSASCEEKWQIII